MAKKGKTSKRAAPSKNGGAAEAKFVEGLIARGEAVPPEEGFPLPPGATHLLVPDEGEKRVKRVRFTSR